MLIHRSNTKSHYSCIYGIWSPNIYAEGKAQCRCARLLGNISCEANADPSGSRATVQYTVCVSKDPTMHFYPLEENRFQAGPVVFPQENYLIQEKQGIAKLFVWVSGG